MTIVDVKIEAAVGFENAVSVNQARFNKAEEGIKDIDISQGNPL
jgi:Cu/Ag efflux protein CusF